MIDVEHHKPMFPGLTLTLVGGMHVSKTETTYELDGVSNEDPEPDRGPDTTIQTRHALL